MRVGPARAATTLALAAWAGLFWYLLLSGRWTLYLSSRTQWVIPMGAVILTLAALAGLATVRTAEPEPIGRSQAWGLGLVVLPVVAVLALPPTTLGSYAADRRSVGTGFVSGSAEIGEEITLVDVAGAQWSQQAVDALARRAGSRVDFTGIVTRRPGMPADEFVLTRFMVSCCAADAIAVQVRVVGAPPGRLEEDQWVRVVGAIYPLPEEVVVDASSVEGVDRPADPYLNV